MKMISACCGKEAIERSFPSLLISRTVYICTNCENTCSLAEAATSK
jgi:hypothetical protein